jgi:general secretion pathway protein A
VVLTGEIGAGKTTVCRCFLEQVPRRVNVAYIINPKQTADELLRSICVEFRIPHEQGTSAKEHVDAINEFLLRTHAVGQNSVLVIDEAQNLGADVLEQLRLLTNLETNERKLLQIILIGQPELRAMLQRPDMEQLAQRVVARFHLEALSVRESAQYVLHRLNVAGLRGAVPFDRAAIRRVHQLTRGVPRRINLLCDRALLGAYASGRPVVDRRIIDQAAREVTGYSGPRLRWRMARRWRIAVAAAAGMIAGAALFALVARLADRPGDAARSPAAPAAARQ